MNCSDQNKTMFSEFHFVRKFDLKCDSFWNGKVSEIFNISQYKRTSVFL